MSLRTRLMGALSLMVTIGIIGVVLPSVATPSVASASSAPAPWHLCTEADFTNHAGNCFVAYGSYNYMGVPANLAGPASITISPSLCPKGSIPAENGYYCSAPFELTVSGITFGPGVYDIHPEDQGMETAAGLNEGTGHTGVTPYPVLPGQAPWCGLSATGSGCAGPGSEATSAPMILLGVGVQPGTFTNLICVGGQVPYGSNQFEACIQASVTATTKAVKSKSSGLKVAVVGQKGKASNTVDVTMTLTNTGASDVSGLSFTDPTGLENDGVLIAKGNIGPTQSGLTLTDGPTPVLPTTLPANGPPVVVHYTYTATSPGDAVLVAKATGTNAAGNTVIAKSAVTVYVTNPPTSEADYQGLVTTALLAEDSVVSDGENTIANAEADTLASSLNLPAASPGQQAAAVQLGLPTQMGVLVGVPNQSALSQWFDNYSATLAGDLKGGVSYVGKTGLALATQLVDNITDPQARAAALGRLWDGIQALPANTRAALASQADNIGYAGVALAVSLTPQGKAAGLSDTAAAGVSALNSLQANVTYAVDGFTDAQVADAAAYRKDPTGYLKANSAQYANATYDLIKTEVATVLGDGIVKGVTAAAKAGYSALSSSASAIDSSVAATVDSTAPAASNSTSALMQNASVATSQFQTLPDGTTLAIEQAAQLAGMLPGDQVGVQKALDYIYKKFGVQLELGVRTSEPLSVGIDGSPKLSFMKPKAVSAMDMQMGAPPQIAAYAAPGQAASGQVFEGGVTTVFQPTPISQATLDAIGETNPNFVTQYNSRYASQLKLWNDYQNTNSTLRVLIDGSAESPLVAGSAVNRAGVTAIADVPGFRVPPPPSGAQPLVYLQQLDQPAFVQQFGLTTEEAQTLKASLSQSPGAVQVNYLARPNPGGSISFFDGLQNNIPFVSDLDLQYFQPVGGGPWPPGVSMSQVQQEFLNQLQQNVSRLPDHGASGTSFDLTAANIGVADSFTMSVANPRFAQALANNLATRYASQSAIFSANAARAASEAAVTADPAKAKALLTLANSYQKTAATFSKVDAGYLLAKYPPGEKIIVITLGDVRVGYGPSPKS